ncbi:MAG: PIG-L deacetylase family protein [Terriglobales bacterium]
MNAPQELLGRTLVLVAHPDDETAGCGVLLQRMCEPIVVFATDGAPRNEFFWGKYGSRLRYARVREEEARTALALAGVNEVIFLAEIASGLERFVDQELHLSVGDAVDELGKLIERYRPEALLSMAYEGGHPDHDVCSFVIAVLARQFGLPAWEFPLYHRKQTQDAVFQRFTVPHDREETVLEVTPEELAVKRQMLEAYRSQHPFLFEFDPGLERFRRQPVYDYSQPPHGGALNYEAWQWDVTGKQVCAAFAAFAGERRRGVM